MIVEGKSAVVTGSSKGLGRGFAMGLAAEGAKVVVNGTNEADVKGVVDEIKKAGGKAIACIESVATWAGAHKIIQTAVDSFGKIDILVNNAGNLRDRTFMKMTEDDFDQVIAVHLKGTFSCCRAAAEYMSKQNYGRIINITSAAAWRGNYGQANYCSAKAGILGLTYNISQELARYHITVNAVRPAAITRMTQPILESILQRAKEKALKEGKPEPTLETISHGVPERIAPLVVYLASEEAGNINGRVFSMEAHDMTVMSRNVELVTKSQANGWTVETVRKTLPGMLAGLK